MSEILKNSCMSQCSTVVRNTVGRGTIKISEKSRIVATRSSLTPCKIDLKVKGKGPVLDIALLYDEYLLRNVLQSRKWQPIGMS